MLSKKEIIRQGRAKPSMNISPSALHTMALIIILGWSMWALTAQAMEIEVLDLFGL